MITAEIVPIMVDRIVEQFRPVRILLYGSRARGDTGESSDVDLLVVMDDVPDRRQAAVDIRRALRDLPVGKEIVVATPEEISRQERMVGTVIRAAMREGKIVYERQ